MITPDSLDIGHRRLFSLLRAALWNKIPEETLFSGMTEEDWELLIQESVYQGVMMLVYDGMLLLPPELYPPRNIKLSWAVSVDILESGSYCTLKKVGKIVGSDLNNNPVD